MMGCDEGDQKIEQWCEDPKLQIQAYRERGMVYWI